MWDCVLVVWGAPVKEENTSMCARAIVTVPITELECSVEPL